MTTISRRLGFDVAPNFLPLFYVFVFLPLAAPHPRAFQTEKCRETTPFYQVDLGSGVMHFFFCASASASPDKFVARPDVLASRVARTKSWPDIMQPLFPFWGSLFGDVGFQCNAMFRSFPRWKLSHCAHLLDRALRLPLHALLLIAARYQVPKSAPSLIFDGPPLR